MASTALGTARINRTFVQLVRYAVCVVCALIILVPIAIAVVGGLKTNGQLLNRPFSIPDPFVWSNYTDVLRTDGIFAVINWHPLPREQTQVLGMPRGPRTELRMSAEDMRSV